MVKGSVDGDEDEEMKEGYAIFIEQLPRSSDQCRPETWNLIFVD